MQLMSPLSVNIIQVIMCIFEDVWCLHSLHYSIEQYIVKGVT